MSIEIVKVPDLGGAEAVEVIEICVAVGDEVAVEDSLVVLETDKASMEVPSMLAGTVTAIKISDGDTLSEGDIILELETVGTVLVEKTETVVPAEVEPKAVEPAQETAIKLTAELDAVSSVLAVAVPDIGGAENVDVIEICVNSGDEISEGDSLIVLETDKASMEVPAPEAGVVETVLIKEGDIVSQGDIILQLQVVTTSVTTSPVETAAVETKAAEVEEAAQPAAQASSTHADIPAPAFAATISNHVEKERSVKASDVYAGPAVRLLAREMGIELVAVNGSGPKGRITKDDLKAFVKTSLSAKPVAAAIGGAGIPVVPEVDFSQFGAVTIEPLSKIHKITAANMHRSWLNVPHVTQFDDADISDLEDFRNSMKAEAERRGVKITPMPFLLKACAKALQEHPKFNASLSSDGEQMVYKQYVHIGIAVDTPAGLMVPVLRDVDKKSIWDLCAETVELAEKAKNRKLSMAEMQGGCFTISSLGGIGGQGFTPIVNTPEVAILGVSKLAVKPQWNGSEFIPRKMLPLALSYDHRAINGGDAGRFFTYLGELLADIRKLVL